LFVRIVLLVITNVCDSFQKTGVIPAKAGIQRRLSKRHWVPAFAGTTKLGIGWSGTLVMRNIDE
jgi:hypothetical protein